MAQLNILGLVMHIVKTDHVHHIITVPKNPVHYSVLKFVFHLCYELVLLHNGSVIKLHAYSVAL